MSTARGYPGPTVGCPVCGRRVHTWLGHVGWHAATDDAEPGRRPQACPGWGRWDWTP